MHLWLKLDEDPCNDTSKCAALALRDSSGADCTNLLCGRSSWSVRGSTAALIVLDMEGSVGLLGAEPHSRANQAQGVSALVQVEQLCLSLWEATAIQQSTQSLLSERSVVYGETAQAVIVEASSGHLVQMHIHKVRLGTVSF